VQSFPSFRFRITFAKTEAMRYTGHLDLHRAWERTFRRAGLPLKYSQGFNPRPKIQLAAALPLGILGDQEWLDAWLEASHEPGEVLHRLRTSCPPGIEPFDAVSVDPAEPNLQPRVKSATYEAALPTPPEPEDLKARVDQLLSLVTIERRRRNKTYDLRPLILRLEVLPAPRNGTRLRMELKAEEGATGRPEEVLAALDLAPDAACVTRLNLSLTPLHTF
jgi:radical SAM-linked protein